MNRRDLDDLSCIEIRRRLTQRGVPTPVAELLVSHRDRAAAAREILYTHHEESRMSSRRAERRRACAKKDRLTLDQARARAAYLRLNVYGCQYCGGWPVGHPPTRIRQAIRARRAAKDTR